MAVIAKSINDELYFLTVNGQTEVLSEVAAYRLVDALLALLGAESYPVVADGSETKH